MRAIIFSKDRPAQLDLLLNSILKNFNGLFASVVVLYKATASEFDQGYDLIFELHQQTLMIPQQGFFNDTKQILDSHWSHVAFLTDDDLFYRPFRYVPYPQEALDADPDLLTVSLRLGGNTTYCYPMRCEQMTPSGTEVSGDMLKYIWRSGQWDFGYPASLDGNVWRRDDLQELLWGKEFSNPNELEDVLVKATKSARQKLTGIYQESCLVNIPANIVNTTHRNRHGETYPFAAYDLNREFLNGKRLSLGGMDLSNIDAAHCERQLVFNY